ncbi:hypothetical protein DL93DRAFT_2231305 [Clavulina sp. PMI_390]|nr:hypothetical protein DL93DRAFT_2231305 [Clavulina sp. PMI_390]
MSEAILAQETTIQKLNAAMDLLSKRGVGPAPKDLAVLQGWVMANVHGSLINMLKQIYAVGPTIKPSDHGDFVKYSLMWSSVVHAHHHEEETWYFGYLSKAIQVETIEKEHALFHQPLEDMQNYLISCLPAGAEWGITRTKVAADSPNATFDAAKLNAIIDSLVTSFIPHFCDEISYLDADKLRAFVSEDDFKAIMKRAQKEIGGQPGAFHIVGAMHARNPSFPPAPWFVTKILIPHVLTLKDRRIWRFIPAKSYWT